MKGRRRSREVTCQACGAVWPRREARYCGTCGSAMAPATAGSDRSGRRPPARGFVFISFALLAVGAVVTGVVAAGPQLEQRPGPGDDEVGLPEPDQIGPDGDGPDEALVAPETPTDDADPADAPEGRPTLVCQPVGCERWRTALPPGSTTPADDTLIHVSRKVGPPTDWPDEGREEPSRDFATISAVDPVDGQLVWREELQQPLVTRAPVRVFAVDDELMLIAWAGDVVALDPVTGERRWSQHLGYEVTEVRTGDAGHPVVWGPEEPPELVGHDEREVAARRGSMASFDRRSGSLRWRTAVELVLFAEGQAVTVSEDRASLVGIDLDDLMHRWRREHTLRPERPPVPLAGGGLALISDDDIEIIDTASGETRALRAVELPPEHHVEVVGTTAVVHREVADASMSPTERRRFSGHLEVARSSVYLFDLSDPDRSPTRVGNVVDVVALRTEPTPGSQPTADEGLAIVSQPDGWVHLTVVDGDGSVRLERETGLMSERCCWLPLPITATEAVMLADPAAEGSRVAILSTTDATEPRIITLPRGRTITDVLGSHGQFIAAHGSEGVGTNLWLHAGDAWSRVVGRSEVVTVEPGPVIQTRDGLIGLDLDRHAWVP